MKMKINTIVTRNNKFRPLVQELLIIFLVVGLLWVGSQVFEQKVISGSTTNFAPEMKLQEWQNQTLKWRTGMQTQVLANFSWQVPMAGQNWLIFSSNQNVAGTSEATRVFIAQQEARWATVAEENQALRAALELKSSETVGLNLVAAPILSLTQKLIELPVNVKPEVGQVVMGKNSLLGWIGGVSQQRATVTLLKDATSSRLIGRTEIGASGLVVNRRGNLYLTEVPTQTEIAVGDVVITENQLSTPAGLIIGRVQSVATDESGTIQTALLVPEEYFGQQAVVWLQGNK